MLYGYLRVSTTGQNERGQRAEIKRWAAGQPVRYLVDRESGDTLDRPAFRRLQACLKPGDTVVVWTLDRLSRSILDGLNTLAAWCEQGVRVVSVTQALDFNGTIGKMLASIFFALGEMEQQTRRERQAAGIAAARASGKRWGGGKPGRRVRLTEAKEATIKGLRQQGISVAEIARIVGLSRPSVYRALDSPRR